MTSDQILDDRAAWSETFETTWLAHFRQTGETDFKSRYPRPSNRPLRPSGGLDLQGARLLLVSTAGGYDPSTQAPFDAPNPLGDYTIRELPFDGEPETLSFAHDHYDGAARDEDVGVLLPHRLLRERWEAGMIGEIVPTWVSFMGYQPDLGKVVDEVCPRVVEVALREHAQAALLVPS